jgi:hypothetical protein
MEREKGRELIPHPLPHVPTQALRKTKAMVAEKEKKKAIVPIVVSPNPFKDMECSHCGKKGHPARNCYKRLNAQLTKLSQNTTVINEPATTIAFQQFVTYVKRKADKQESDAEKDQQDVGDQPSTSPALALTLELTDEWGSSSASVEPTWGRTSNDKYEKGQHEWYEESSTSIEPNRYSPERNRFRSVTCDL